MTQQLLLHETLLKLQEELSNNSNNIIIDYDEEDSMMPSTRRRSSSRRQVRPAYTENKEDDECLYYRPKSKREGGGSRGRDRSSLADISCSSRQLVVYGEEAPSSSSKRNSCPVENTRRHNYRHDESDMALINGSCGDRDHEIQLHSSSASSRHHHERPSGASRRRPSDQSLVSSINTTSTHPSTSNDGDYLAVQDVDYDDYEDGYGQYMAYESKARTSSRSSSRRRRNRRSCSTKSRSRSSSSSHHHQQYHHDRRHDDAQHRSSYSPIRSRRRAPRRRSPDAHQLRSSFASNGSQRSTRTLPTSSSSSSSHNNRSSRPVPTRRRSSDDLRALEADDLRVIERAASHGRRRRSSSRRSGRNHRRRDDDSSYSRHRHRRRRSVSSSSSSSSRRSDDPPADATVNLRISHSSTSRVIDGKTPRKQNHSTKSNKKKKNSIDLTIDNNGQGTFQVVTSSSTQPLQFDIQIDEDQSSYLIQTSLGLLHQIREVHTPNTNILRTLTYWNSYFERQEVELGYHRGELGIVSTKSREMKQSVPKVPGGGGGVRVKPTFAKQEVVLMTLTGGYHGGKASSFEMDDVFIKELELFVTDSLWCYLRLHGLKEDSSSKKEDLDEDDLGNSHHPEESNENTRNGSQDRVREDLKNGRKKERVLSRVFKRVIGE